MTRSSTQSVRAAGFSPRDRSRGLKPAAQSSAAIRRKLLRWYDRNKRDLPWRRRANDPYAQWVAEVMLQQTRVETVIEYYEPFLRRFPTLRRLAEADHEDALKQWEGLGYYRRILHLHRAAKMVCERGGGTPDTADGLRTLPGVGEYTAAAIASIAFNRPEAAVDGNVARVLARLFGVTEDVRTTAGKSRIRGLARSLLPARRPGDFNQAWMDLGSLVCTPRTPDCRTCPLRSECVAGRSGNAETFPVRDAARNHRPKDVSLVVAVFVNAGKVLVAKRPTGGLWSGLWEFPTMELPTHRTEQRCVARLARENCVMILGRPARVATVRHQLTHRSLRFHVYACQVERGHEPRRRDRRWVDRRAFEKLAVSTGHRRVFDVVTQGTSSKCEVQGPKKGTLVRSGHNASTAFAIFER